MTGRCFIGTARAGGSKRSIRDVAPGVRGRMIPAAQAEVAALLRRLAGADPVETHISAVFVGPDTAWKLKKAVALGFLDFSSPGAREHFLRRGLGLHRPPPPRPYPRGGAGGPAPGG